ncbi:MAG: DNA topoisomerase I [Candidatus Thermoplasmatota archaeon]|nr:DNA topoisomerase I [Candidatus Thermoplasmatota archaeon]
MKMLVICEKDMAARRIAYILSNGKVSTSRLNGIPYYMFNGDEWRVIGLRGHIIKLDYPQQYNRWDGISPLKLVDIEPIKKVSNRNIADALKKLAEGVDRVIVATDYDREGELIGVEGLEILPKKFDAERAKFSSLIPQEIKKTFDNPARVDYNLAESAEARRIIDLAWGASLTRFISLASNQLGRDFLSVGRVQSPTLALIVDKEKEIEKFIPVPYWMIGADMISNEIQFTAYHAHGKFWEKEKADAIYDKIKGITKGRVTLYQRERKEEYPPSPFDTTSFLREASRLGFTAASAMKIAESLYMKGLISYPRTDNTVYPPGMQIRAILGKLRNAFPEEVRKVIENGRKTPTKGKKISHDHPPIHPVDAADKTKMDVRDWKLYELITRRFLATLSKNAVVEVSKAEIDVGGEQFAADGYEIIEKNWKEIYTYLKTSEQILKLKEGEEIDVIAIKKMKKETKPPGRYSQGSLLAEMEKNNLGTKSTRHEIIEKLYYRNYIKGKRIMPTLAGRAVIEALEKNAEIITKPDMTAELEKEMNEIAERKKSLKQVVDESRDLLRRAIKMMEERKDAIGKVIKDAMSKQNFAGKCNKCGGDLTIIKSRKGKRFIGCSNFPKCNNSYPLPQKGNVIFEGGCCQYCGAPIVTIIYKRKWKKCVNPGCKSNSS